MRESTLENYRNPTPYLNSTFSTAVAVVNHLAKIGWWEALRAGLPRPTEVSAMVVPIIPPGPETEKLDASFFGHKGVLNSELLNHYVQLEYPGLRPLRISTGYLAQYFVIGRADGLAETGRLVTSWLQPALADPEPAAAAPVPESEEESSS